MELDNLNTISLAEVSENPNFYTLISWDSNHILAQNHITHETFLVEETQEDLILGLFEAMGAFTVPSSSIDNSGIEN